MTNSLKLARQLFASCLTLRLLPYFSPSALLFGFCVTLRLAHSALRLGFLGFAFQGALEGLIEGGLGFLVFCWRDLVLAAFDFQLEEFFF
jgi:hypothetical protein